MSSLIYKVEKNQVFIATDTLATLNGRAIRFTTKAFPLPHLRMVIAGIGLDGFLDHWLVAVNAEPVRGIDSLNEHAQAGLLNVLRTFKKQFPGMNETTSIYHFGFSENTGVIQSFAYKSEEQFEPRQIAYGLYVKPSVPEDMIPRDTLHPGDIPRIMAAQRAIQAKLPKEARVSIGGEMHMHHLEQAGYESYRLGQFEDYAETRRAILATEAPHRIRGFGDRRSGDSRGGMGTVIRRPMVHLADKHSQCHALRAA
jgi:hypothetical protein